MYYTVIELCELRLVPSVGSANEITGNALQAVNVGAAALGASVHRLFCVFIAAIHAAIAGVVDTAVSDVVFVHHVHDAHHSFGVVSGISVNLHIEDVAATCEFVIRGLHLCLVQCRAVEINWYMIGVCVVVAVCNAGQNAELLTVALGETTCKTFLNIFFLSVPSKIDDFLNYNAYICMMQR